MNNTFIAFLLALLPGIVWLIYFLKKDISPEPKRNILRVFLAGILISPPVLLFEMWLLKDLQAVQFDNLLYLILKLILVVALIEEMFKYLAVRFFILKTSHIDEPIDIPIYMIIASLGFATIENIFLFCNQSSLIVANPLILTFTRFIGATLLHALCSGIIGFFLALSFYKLKLRRLLIVLGFSLAIFIHAIFNFFAESSIIKQNIDAYGFSSIPYSFVIVLILFIIFSFSLRIIKNLKSVCKL